MTREEMLDILKELAVEDFGYPLGNDAIQMAIKALSQESHQLLVIKSDILLHQDDRNKWMDSIKREKENGVIILPPYFEPLLVPDNIEIEMEHEPCDELSQECVEPTQKHVGNALDMHCEDAISRQAVFNAIEREDKWLLAVKGHNGVTEIAFSGLKGRIDALPSVTQKSGKWIDYSDEGYVECPFCGHATNCEDDIDELHYCFYCGSGMRGAE